MSAICFSDTLCADTPCPANATATNPIHTSLNRIPPPPCPQLIICRVIHIPVTHHWYHSCPRPSEREPMARVALDDPRYYFNRHIQWLEFNRRVLEEARD